MAEQRQAPGLFARVANEVLHASERVINAFEDGVSVLMTGQLGDNRDGEHTTASTSMDGENEFEANADEMEFTEEEMNGLDDMEGSPLSGIANSVMGDILSKQSGPQTITQHVQAFTAAITWHEPFILSLVAFHVTLFVLCIYTSRHGSPLWPRLTIMCALFVLVRGSEYANTWAAAHWEMFATQNYFDRRGIFATVMICGPLLVDAFVMLVLFLREASLLLVQVKTAELKRKKKLQKGTVAGKEAETKKEQ